MIIHQEKKFRYSGNLRLLAQINPIVVFSSRNIPQQYMKEYENFYKSLLEQTLAIAGGWHSPFEKQILKWWQKTTPCPLLYITAKSLDLGMNQYKKLFSGIDVRNYLIVDPLITSDRISAKTVLQRNNFMLNQFDNFIFTHIQSGGNCETLLEQAENKNKNVFLFNHISNEMYFSDNITLIDPFTFDILKCI